MCEGDSAAGDDDSPPDVRVAPAVVESCFAGGVVAGLLLVVWRSSRLGYLTQPFHYRASETFLDYFNTAFWSYRIGAYSEWRSIYPPIALIFSRIFSTKSCYNIDAIIGRYCDYNSIYVLYGLFLLNFVLVLMTYRR